MKTKLNLKEKAAQTFFNLSQTWRADNFLLDDIWNQILEKYSLVFIWSADWEQEKVNLSNGRAFTEQEFQESLVHYSAMPHFVFKLLDKDKLNSIDTSL